MLLALGIVCALLVGGQNIPFFGNVAANIMTFVKDLGSNGLVGLIALGFILWLFSNRRRHERSLTPVDGAADSRCGDRRVQARWGAAAPHPIT